MIAGKDKGKTGKVIRVDPQARAGLRRGPEHGQAPPAPAARAPEHAVGVIEKEGPLHVSNVAILDPKDKKPTRVRVERRDDGGRMRVTTRSGAELD